MRSPEARPRGGQRGRLGPARCRLDSQEPVGSFVATGRCGVVVAESGRNAPVDSQSL
jgi:hypothetical protein